MEQFLYNRQIKNNTNFNMWFFFAGPESFALSSLGYLNLFKEIDETPDINVERVYSDKKNTQIMREKINLIAVSFSFDFDFIHIFEFLEKNKFEIKSQNRQDSDPIIFAGGPVVTANPEPYSQIFDAIVIGDGEDTTLQIAKICQEAKLQGISKDDTLKRLSKIEGVYIPKFFDKKTQKINKITKKIQKPLYTPIISDKAFFANTFIVEVERGCANRCGFCLASYINLPIRFAPCQDLISIIDKGLNYTNKIALLGAQVTAHPQFIDLCKHIDNRINSGENIQMSVSSLRVDAFKEEIVSTLVKAGQKNLTLAIEAASQRLRNVINKNITNEQIFNAIDVAKKCGLKGIKFYAMLGLPTETNKDIEEFITLANEIKNKYKGFDISFGFSTFVPKANTPFQRIGRVDSKTLEKRANYLTKELRKIGVDINISSIKWDYYQAVLSRADETLTDYMIDVYKNGAKLGAFKKSAKNLNIDIDYYALKTYEYEKSLPWDYININPSKEFLNNECKRLLSQTN